MVEKRRYADRREELIKARMQKVYETKLKEHEKIQEAELARKKTELAKELQERAQKLFA